MKFGLKRKSYEYLKVVSACKIRHVVNELSSLYRLIGMMNQHILHFTQCVDSRTLCDSASKCISLWILKLSVTIIEICAVSQGW